MDARTRAGSRAQTIALVIIATVLIGWVLHIGASILQPMIIALLLANVLQPVVTALEKRKIPGPVAVLGLTVILFYSLFQVGWLVQESVATFLGPEPAKAEASMGGKGAGAPVKSAPIKNQGAPAVKKELPANEQGPAAEGNSVGESTADPTKGEASETEGKNEEVEETTWGQMVTRLSIRVDQWQLPSDDIKKTVKNALKEFDAKGALASLIGGGINFTRSLVVILIYMAFIFAEQNIFRRKMLAVAGTRKEEAARAIDTISKGIQRYLSIKTLVSILTGTVCYFLLVICEIPYAEVFGLLTVLLNYIPTFGSIVAGLPPTITALAVHESWVPAVAIAVGYATVNLVLGTILEPRVLGRELNISPLIIIISVVVWGGIWGIVGAFLAVPLTATIQIILASSEKGRPIAILLSGHPPAEDDPEEATRPQVRLPLRRRKRS
ncbi:MAG: AI-2E family transporter [Planctomycetes bacterium]|nr:AI-2E family transporter [Planctomycetota bacterium]